ncbi:MAG: hypothetical protein M3Y41_13210 [Pseudomonadota bacterium]|nr:hypothetical protein [Pseudomonadota bacterium]
MIRQYHAQRCQGGRNPLRVGVIPNGAIFYLQDEGFFRGRFGGRAVCRTPWMVEGFLNGTMGAARCNRDTGCWEDAYRSGRSDMALVRSLRDRRIIRQVAVRTLIVHEELGLCKQPIGYPTLPDVQRFIDRATATARSGRTESSRLASRSF